jgi:hypothetical protein
LLGDDLLQRLGGDVLVHLELLLRAIDVAHVREQQIEALHDPISALLIPLTSILHRVEDERGLHRWLWGRRSGIRRKSSRRWEWNYRIRKSPRCCAGTRPRSTDQPRLSALDRWNVYPIHWPAEGDQSLIPLVVPVADDDRRRRENSDRIKKRKIA